MATLVTLDTVLTIEYIIKVLNSHKNDITRRDFSNMFKRLFEVYTKEVNGAIVKYYRPFHKGEIQERWHNIIITAYSDVEAAYKFLSLKSSVFPEYIDLINEHFHSYLIKMLGQQSTWRNLINLYITDQFINTDVYIREFCNKPEYKFI